MTERANVAVIGGGPAGAFAASLLAPAVQRVILFDEHMAWEKPCGGGLTVKALRQYSFLCVNSQPKQRITQLEMSIAGGPSVQMTLRDPIYVYSREVLNRLVLERAKSAGCEMMQEHITSVEPNDAGGWYLHGTHNKYAADFVVIATGARNAFRAFALPSAQSDTSMTVGYFVPGTRDLMDIEFQPGLEGYLWIFPRDTHMSVGVCGTLLREPTHKMRERLDDYMRRKGLTAQGAQFFSHRLPALRREAWRSLRASSLAGPPPWAAIGDAAGLVDPITGEGLYYALRSAELMAESYLAGRIQDYTRRLRDDFGRDLELGARIADRFYHGTFLGAPVTTRMIQFAARSRTFAALMQDLFAGTQGYLGLKQRLLKNLNTTLAEVAASFFRLHSAQGHS